MACIADADVGNWFRSTMEDIRNKLQASGEIIDTGIDLGQSHNQYVRSVLDTCSNKLKDDETLFETIQVYKRDLVLKNTSIREREGAISQLMSDVEGKETQKDSLLQKVESLKAEHAKSRELIVSQNKANKDRLKNLNKDKRVFQDHLGLEIRKIHGEKLQFIFRNINQADPDSVHSFLLRISEDGKYKIESSDPPLDCIAYLEQRLQETNNFTAFIANVRKEFVALSKS